MKEKVFKNIKVMCFSCLIKVNVIFEPKFFQVLSLTIFITKWSDLKNCYDKDLI